MATTHTVLFADSRRMADVPTGSVNLIVTSPPYPLIEMWDDAFARMSPGYSDALARGQGQAAFELAHRQLDEVWRQCYRVLQPGGFACINVGDATRTLAARFRLYSNHARVITAFDQLGFTSLPDVLWRKQTNSPNKFMGSGMLPAGAYVTYEHEYILIFRKGPGRSFTRAEDKALRRRSAFFWEERNTWFSDVWTDLKGTAQRLPGAASRARSGAFPFELAFRLISMYSVVGDMVLDPFLGTGTTTAAAIASERSSVGLDVDHTLEDAIRETVHSSIQLGRRRAMDRIVEHERFIASRLAAGHGVKHSNSHYSFPVVTAQEKELRISAPKAIREASPMRFEAEHEPIGERPDASEAPSKRLNLLGA